MKDLLVSRNIFDRQGHGYFSARGYFRGRLTREVFVTVFELVAKRSYYGYLFLTEHNSLLTILKDRECHICEFEPSDTFQEIEKDSNSLKEVLSDSGYDINLSVRTSSPVSYIRVNSRYLLLCSIQPDISYEGFRINLMEYYFTEKNYREKVRNLIKVISTLVRGGKFEGSQPPLPGIGPNLALLNIIIVSTTMPVVVLVFIFGFVFLVYTRL